MFHNSNTTFITTRNFPKKISQIFLALHCTVGCAHIKKISQNVQSKKVDLILVLNMKTKTPPYYGSCILNWTHHKFSEDQSVDPIWSKAQDNSFVWPDRAVASEGAGGAGGKQLTLSQPGGQVMPTTVLRAPPPYFQTLQRPYLIVAPNFCMVTVISEMRITVSSLLYHLVANIYQ